MKKLHLLWIALFCVCVVGCGGDDDSTPTPTAASKNENSNKYVPSGQTEYPNITNVLEASKRLEIPQLKKGGNNLFIVHTVPELGVNYCIEYDCDVLASRWTAYAWYPGFCSKESNWNRNSWKRGETYNGFGGTGDPFQPDPLIPRDYQTQLEDHSMNGHDRGHMLGSADRLNSKEANGQTFYLSNMHPQLAAFNQGGIWFNLEERLRKQYDIDSFRDTLYVVKGGTIGNGQYTTVRGASGRNLPVPKYFFMALLCKNKSTSQGGYKAIGFWMPHKANTDSNFAAYAKSIDELEQLTGIDFFCNLPDDIEKVVEANKALNAWGIN